MGWGGVGRGGVGWGGMNGRGWDGSGPDLREQGGNHSWTILRISTYPPHAAASPSTPSTESGEQGTCSFAPCWLKGGSARGLAGGPVSGQLGSPPPSQDDYRRSSPDHRSSMGVSLNPSLSSPGIFQEEAPKSSCRDDTLGQILGCMTKRPTVVVVEGKPN